MKAGVLDAGPVSLRASGTMARLEKGHAPMRAGLGSEQWPVKAGLGHARVEDANFIGRAAYVQARTRHRPRSCAP